MLPSYEHKTYETGYVILEDGTARPLTPEERERYARLLAQSMEHTLGVQRQYWGNVLGSLLLP